MYKIIFTIACILTTSCQQKINISNAIDSNNTKQTILPVNQNLEAIKIWKIKGAIAFNSVNNHGTGSIIWQQNYNNYDVRIIGPLGSGAIHFFGDPKKITYIDGHNKIISDDPYRFLAKISQLHVPLNQLSYWVKGLKAPGKAITEFDSEHKISNLKQNGFNISYLSYKKYTSLTLPNKIKIINKDVNIKLVISSWQTNL